jgi:hypothetical protein
VAKTNATFKLGKMAKLSMGATFNREERCILKNAFIDAQATYISQKGRKFSDPASAQRGGNKPQATPTAE